MRAKDFITEAFNQVAEDLTEIENLPARNFDGKRMLRLRIPAKRNLQPLLGSTDLLYAVDQAPGGDPRVVIVEPGVHAITKPQIVAVLQLEPVDYLPNTVQVGFITVDEDYRGRGLAKALYGIVFTKMRKNLLSGDTQTPGGKRNWISLVNMPGVQVKGLVQISNDIFDFNKNQVSSNYQKYIDQTIDQIMELGGQFFHKNKDFSFWLFDVVPGKGQLQPYVQNSLSKLYGYDARNLLLATWNRGTNESQQGVAEGVNQVDFNKNLLTILQQKYPGIEFSIQLDRVESADGELTVIANTADQGSYVGCFMWDVSTGPYTGALGLAIKQTTDQLLQANPGKKPALFIGGDNENPEAWAHIADKLNYKLITDDDESEEGVAEDAENFNGIDISLEIQKDDEYVDDEDYDNQVIYVTASSNGRELGHVLFSIDGEYLMPQDLEVEERFRGQGIAQTMYDYVKSKGYKIRRSGQQTDAGAGFWGKHRPEQNVWEGANRGGIDLKVTELPDEDQILITATSHGKTLGRVYFDIFDSQLVAADAEVASEYRGQGIAAIIYDYAKELGWEVVRSGRQTDAGAGFWDKHRPKQDVWEDAGTKINFTVQKSGNKFATTMTVNGEPAGVYQYNADTGRSVAEVYPEYRGKGLGKLLVLHAIYTAAKLGLDFQEDESRTSEYDNVLDSLSGSGYIVDDEGYWYVTGEGEQFLKQSMKQGVAEAFNQPYATDWEKSEHDDYDSLVQLPDGSHLSVMFNNQGDGEYQVEFWRGPSQGVTGEGDAQRIFATVLNTIQRFIKEHNPWRLTFSATKDVEPGQNSESRAKLYNRLVDRYAAAWGYDALINDLGDQVEYELTRLKPNVAENFADGKVKGKSRPGRVKRSGASCNGSVTDLRQRAKNASGERAKMYHWCANMKSGKK